MRYEEERMTIIRTCKLLQGMEYFLGTWGNVSMRVGENILLTPSRVDYDNMTPEDMVVINMNGDRVEGQRNATSEKEVHRQIYLIREDVGAIIHAHTPKAMALSAAQIREVPCVVEEMSQLLGGSIPLAKEYVPAEQHVLLGKAAAEAIGNRNGVILRNHGPVSCGKDIKEAVLAARIIEKACGIYLSLLGQLNIREIPQKYVESERYRFLYTYGKEKT
jgi:L-ribulose-5-phosphate 4-epimerase